MTPEIYATLKRWTCIVTAVAAVSAIAVASSEAQKSAPVTVTNTPLPVSATQSGTWNFSITNSPTVRDADHPGRLTPLLGEGTTLNAANQVGCSNSDGNCNRGLFQVPAGKRLVLEYVSMHACMRVGQVATTYVTVSEPSDCQVGGSCLIRRIYYLTLSPPAVATDSSSTCPSPGSAMTSVGQSMRIYANPGQVVAAGALHNTPDTGGANYVFGLSGYLVDAQ